MTTEPLPGLEVEAPPGSVAMGCDTLGVLATFHVYGTPRPKGSKVAFLSHGRAMLKEQNEEGHRDWHSAVTGAAMVQAKLIEGTPFDGALALEVTFRFRVPKIRERQAIANGGQLHHTIAPDTSKLVRSIEDDFKAAGLIVDDSRFAVLFASKVEVLPGAWTGADITIRRLA